MVKMCFDNRRLSLSCSFAEEGPKQFVIIWRAGQNQSWWKDQRPCDSQPARHWQISHIWLGGSVLLEPGEPLGCCCFTGLADTVCKLIKGATGLALSWNPHRKTANFQTDCFCPQKLCFQVQPRSQHICLGNDFIFE